MLAKMASNKREFSCLQMVSGDNDLYTHRKVRNPKIVLLTNYRKSDSL